MEIILIFILLIVLAIGGFYAICHIVKIWTGCDTDEAVRKIQNFCNGTANVDFTTDAGFIEEIWSNVRNIIGETRFNQLVKLQNTSIGTSLLSTGFDSGLPFIAICVFYADDSEKRRIENILKNVLEKYLHRFGYDTRVIAGWKQRFDIAMPYLELQYAKTREQKQILSEVLMRSQNDVIAMNTE